MNYDTEYTSNLLSFYHNKGQMSECLHFKERVPVIKEYITWR